MSALAEESRYLKQFTSTKSLNCACVGGDSRTPLGIVSFAENAIMAVMGGVLLFSTLTGEAELAKLKKIEPTAIFQQIV